MAEKKLLDNLEDYTCNFRDRFRNDAEILDDTQIFSPASSCSDENTNKIDWLDQYTNAHRIAEENIEFMRIWLLKISLVDLLNELKTNYVGKTCVFSHENDRHRIQQFIDLAIEKHDVRYLIKAYTANTSFFRVLNKDLAKRGSTFRFESKISDRLHDDQVPLNLGEYLFTACLTHHPSVDQYYRPCEKTYRGMNLTQSELDQYIPGARILIRSFLSTSRRAEVASMFLDFVSGQQIPVVCIYRITQSRTALDVSEESAFPEEKEVLIRPFAVFYVKNVERASFQCGEHRKATQIFLDELPSTTERWETNGIESNQNSLTDVYDIQGRLVGVEQEFSRLAKKNTNTSVEEEEEISDLECMPSLLTNIKKMIQEILFILSRTQDTIPSQSTYFESIKDMLNAYCLGEYSLWTLPLLKRLNQTICTIKQLLQEKENGENYDADYLKILFLRVEQRASNIDYGIHFPVDVPLIMQQLEYENVLDERRKNRCIPQLLFILNERFAIQCTSYIQKCIDLHSHIRIMSIGKDNVEQIASQLDITLLTSVEKEHLSQKCDPLVIPLQSFVSCTTIESNVPYHRNQLSFEESQRRSLTDNIKQQTLVNDSRDLYRLMAETPFLPPTEFQSNSSSQKKPVPVNDISSIIDKYRWIVILGDPGSAKTTLVRWLTLLYAKQFIQNRNNSNSPARLPVLVRVGEIATALDHNASLSLLDCLCQPTWFGTPLIQMNNDEQFIREYIKHGHALIILDGLDEIPNFRQRQHIVQLIEQFLEEWTVCPVTCIAPFDELIMNDKVKPFSCSTVGNQVIITSRIVGYYLCPIASNRVAHYILAPLSLSVMNSFIDHWFMSIYSSLEISKLNSYKVMKRVGMIVDEMKSMLSNNEELQKLISSPMMLAVLCILRLLQSHEEMFLLRKQRICLLDTMSKFTLQSSLRMSDRRDVFLHLLIDIALYLHEHSSSGLIEELNMKNILRKSVNNDVDIVDDFIRLIDEETCLFVPRGLCVYGFSHLIFEEYYVCLHILKFNENDVEFNRYEYVADQFYRHILCGSRFREPLILALSYISWQWSETEYNLFCNCLLNNKDISQFSDVIPLGAICLLSSISDLVRLPSTELLCTMLNQCLQASTTNKWFYNFPTFFEILITAMNELPVTFVHQWFLGATDNAIETIGQLLLRINVLPPWFDQCICHHMWNHLMLTNHRLSCCLFPLISSFLPKNDLCQYMITNGIRVENIHSLIFSIIICLCGGLNRSEGTENIIEFSPELMQRNSPYSAVLTQYLYSDPQALLNYCHHELASNSSSKSLDLLVMCSCLEGCKDEWLTLPFVQRLQQLAIYVCSIYLGKKYSYMTHKPTTEQILTLLAPLIDCNQQNVSLHSSASIIIIALSRLVYVRNNYCRKIEFPYKLCNLEEDQLDSELFSLSRSFQSHLIPGAYRHLFSSQCLSTTHRTFLSAAYIIELSIDVSERWCKRTKLPFTEDSIQEILTFEVARWIDTQIPIADEEECRRLSHALHKCKTFIDVNTANIIIQWLPYNNQLDRREFAYHAAFLLFNIHPTATILCCQLLGSELDDFRRRSEEFLCKNIISCWHLGQDGLKSLVEIRQNWPLSMPYHVLESFERIQIRLEQTYSLSCLYILLENIETANILESFSFIFDPSTQPHFITKLEKCHEATENSISAILRIFSRTKGKWNKFEVNRGITAVVRLLHKYADSVRITSAALAVLTRWKSYNYIKHIIAQTRYPDSIRIHAIRWLYTTGKTRRLSKILRRLTLGASSSVVDAAWGGMILQACSGSASDNQEPTTEILLNCCDDDYLRLFRALIALHTDSRDLVRTGYDYCLDPIFTELCIEHKFESMDAVFVDTICIGLMEAENNPFSTLSDTHLRLVVEYIERREVEFFRAVQKSILGEQGFKKALYAITKKSDVGRRLTALNLLVYYGELTIEIAETFLNLALENFFHQEWACKFIWRLRRVPNRQISEYLLKKLKSESLQQRYMAAILLVQLAVNDQVSMNTVCRYIKNVINDATSANDIYLTSQFFRTDYSINNELHRKGRLDQALATLLMQFSFIAGKPYTNAYKLKSPYDDLFLNYNLLFEQIREAPRFVFCRYKRSRPSNSVDYRSDEDNVDFETTEYSDERNYF